MEIVDAQLHEPAAWLDWSGADDRSRRKVLTELTLAPMEAVGVDAALLFPIEDEGWAELMAAEYPGRFASIVMYRDMDAFDLPDRIAALRERPGVVGLRFSMGVDPAPQIAVLESGAVDAAFAAAEDHDIPLFLGIGGYAGVAGPIASAYPNLTIIVDHLGLMQPPTQPRDDPPFARLPSVLELARFPNVAVKVCGAPALSEEPFPFLDVWPAFHQILEAFGPERLMWASDIGRFRGRIAWNYRIPLGEGEYPGKHTYAESLSLFRDTDQLSQDEKEFILGGTARRLLRWPAISRA